MPAWVALCPRTASGLVPQEKSCTVELPQNETTTLGRGDTLCISDRTLSRNVGVVEVRGTSTPVVTVQSASAKKPILLQRAGTDEQRPVETRRPTPLRHLDRIWLRAGAYCYQLKIEPE